MEHLTMGDERFDTGTVDIKRKEVLEGNSVVASGYAIGI